MNMDQQTNKKLGVLIGGSGLIGGTLVHYFHTNAESKIDVRAPSSKKLSIRQSEDIRKYLGRVQPDFVINTAMSALDSGSHLAFEVNYLGTVNLARACCSLGIPYIHISSASALPSGENLSENDYLALSPDLNNYAKSKLMSEKTLAYMGRYHNLDYTIIRLAIVYGEHDHKIQGFHRLFFAIADESMPFLITKKGVMHSYSNADKLPYFVHHVIEYRKEFTGEIYHFVDPEPVLLDKLIMTIRSYLELSRPLPVYIPYPVVLSGNFLLKYLARVLNWFGITVRMPPELMFLENLYKIQTLNNNKLQQSSFKDPKPDETIFTALPRLVVYYLARWGHLNLIKTFNEKFFDKNLIDDFQHSPEELLHSIHRDSTAPFINLLKK